MAESSSLPGSSDRGRGGWVSFFVFVARIGTIVGVGANGLEASELLGCCAAVLPTETLEKNRERDRGERRELGLGRRLEPSSRLALSFLGAQLAAGSGNRQRRRLANPTDHENRDEGS